MNANATTASDPVPALNVGRRRARLPWIVPGAIPATVLVSIAVLIPFCIFLVYGFWTEEVFSLDKTFTLNQYSSVLGDPLYRQLLARTLLLGLVVTTVTFPIAYLAAYAVSFKLGRMKNPVLFAIVLSMLGSYLTKIISWKVLLAPAGLVSSGLQTAGITSGRLEGLSTGWFPIIIALTHLMLPLAFLPIYAGMQSIDRDVPNAARDLGAAPMRVGLRVILPLVRRGAATAVALVFVLSCGDYVTPSLFSGGSGTMIGAVIYQQFGITRNWPLASALAVTLIVAIMVSLLLAWAVARGIRYLSTLRTSRRRPLPTLPQMPHLKLAGRRVGWGGPLVTVLLGFLYLPFLVVVVFSFVDREIVALPITGLTTKWYGEALGSESFTNALHNSLQVAALVVLFCLATGVPLGFALSRRRFRLRRALEAAIVVPLLIPGIIVGFALLSAVTQLGFEPGLISAAIGQTALLLPLTVLVVVARLEGFDGQVELAARDLGCTVLGVLRRVTLPILLPTLIATSVIVFAQSMDEFIVTLYTSGSHPTVPVMIWSLLQRRGLTPAVDAIATVMVLGTTITLLVGFLALRVRSGSAAAVRRGLSS